MSLTRYIRDLLYRYECVIVPEFGGFLTKTVSAQIDERSNTLYPPSKKIGFNSLLVENDGLLANYIASIDKVPYETAVNYINFEVSEWQRKLINEDLSLEDIGVFFKNEEGNLQFEPDKNTNFLSESFGLTPVVAPEVARETLMEEEVIFDSISDEILDEEIFVNTDLRKNKIAFASVFKYVAIFAVLFAVGYFLVSLILKNNANLEFVKQKEAEQNALINKQIQKATFEINKTLEPITLKIGDETVISKDNTNSVEEVDATKEEVVSETSDETQTTPKEHITTSVEETKEPKIIIAETASETTSADYSLYKYHIIAGAFKNVANANKKVKQLKKKGYSASIIGVNKWKLNQVAFGSFQNKEEAQKFLRKIKTTEAKDAWMLVK